MKFRTILTSLLALGLLAGCSDSPSTDASADRSRVDSLLGGTAGDVRLNPAHGEPGHRCEIPVGAPLDSEPGNYVEPELTITPQTPGAQQPQIQMQSQPQTNESPAEMLAKGLNPPHGEAGHDCAVPVGAPLKK
jgi:hypothetical protein